MHPALGLLLAYLLGSIPFAYLAGKLAKGIDLRQHGSGNLGATNVYRTLGWKVALVVFLCDVGKGAAAAALLPRLVTGIPGPYALVPGHPYLALGIAYGVAAILGHSRSVFFRFRSGGKGVATSAGVFLALAPWATLAALVTFAIVLKVSGYVSLGSLVAAVVLPLALLLTQGARTPLFVVSLLVAAFVFWTHRANIERLRRGEEHRFGRKAVT